MSFKFRFFQTIRSLFPLITEEYSHFSTFYIFFFIGGILCYLNESLSSLTFPFVLSGILIFCYLIITYGHPSEKRIRIRSLITPLTWSALFFTFGCFITAYRIASLDSPKITHPLYDLQITGTISDSRLLLERQVVVLNHVRFLNQSTIMPPVKVKLTYPAATPLLKIGQTLHAQVYLRPPHTPVYPNAYNESRFLWFQKIGAVGTIQKINTLSPPAEETSFFGIPNIRRIIQNIRTTIQSKIQQAIPDEAAQIAIPLVIGEQGVISSPLYTLFRKAGIVHVLSVSGFHLSLLTAFVFFFVRGILILIPFFIERYSAKKWAACVSLLFATIYTAISGLNPPAIRAFIMIAILLFGILCNRNAFSIRSLSLAAFLMLTFRPEMILNIGFQLSFIAVLILVSLYYPCMRFFFPHYSSNVIMRGITFVVGFLCVDLLSTIATTPFVLFYFNQYPLYSSIGNLLTGLLFSLWIMPNLLFATLCMPFHGEVFFLRAAAIGIEYVISICDKIAKWPHALITLPSFSSLALGLMITGIVLICLMRTRLKIVGLFLIGVGILSAILSPRPDLLIGDRGRTIAYRSDTTNQLSFLTQGPSNYTVNMWRLKDGQFNPDSISNASSQTPSSTSYKQPPSFIFVQGHKIAFTESECPTATVCFLPFEKEYLPNAFPLYTQSVRALYFEKSHLHSPSYNLLDLSREKTIRPWN